MHKDRLGFQCRDESDDLRDRVKVLEAWKSEQLVVESEWDVQAIGKALNIPLGTSIRASIIPAIEGLKQRNDQLCEVLHGLLELGRKDTSNPKYDGFYAEAKATLNRKD